MGKISHFFFKEISQLRSSTTFFVLENFFISSGHLYLLGILNFIIVTFVKTLLATFLLKKSSTFKTKRKKIIKNSNNEMNDQVFAMRFFFCGNN